MSASSQVFYETAAPGSRPRKIASGGRFKSSSSSTKSMENLLALPAPSAGRSQTGGPTGVPHIDLNNFDSPEFDSLDYVLTSPRSLEACHRLGLQPVKLLYKRLQDFELDNPGLPVAQLFELYDKREAERKASLKLARQEREKLMAQESAPGRDEDATLRSNQRSSAGAQQLLLSNGGDGEWESHIRRELADHEVQAERLRLRLESQRLRRLEESKARRDRERQLAADETRRRYQSAESLDSAAASWEARQLQAEGRRRKEQRQANGASEAALQDSAEQLARASRVKSDLDAEDRQRRHQRLKRRESAHRDRSAEMRRAAKRESEAARKATDQRERSATRNHELAQEKKQFSIREQQLMQLERFRSSAERRRRLEAEIDEYKEELRRYRQIAEQRAEEVVNRRSQQMARRAAAKEAQRQAVARRNQREQERAEEAWRRRTESKSIARQEEAARLVEARERERQDARAVAETAARLRANARRGSETFDKKVAQVNLVNRLGLGHEFK